MLEDVGLASRAREPVSSYSAGMKRWLNLACGMVHRPAILLLDKPTAGVDLQSREQLSTPIEGARRNESKNEGRNPGNCRRPDVHRPRGHGSR
jgi:ABC-type multidrug transport system ATPase subunit